MYQELRVNFSKTSVVYIPYTEQESANIHTKHLALKWISPPTQKLTTLWLHKGCILTSRSWGSFIYQLHRAAEQFTSSSHQATKQNWKLHTRDYPTPVSSFLLNSRVNGYMLLWRSLHQAIPILTFCGFFNKCKSHLYLPVETC